MAPFAIGMVGRSLRIALVIAPLVIVSYVLGLPYGPSGVALAYSAAMTLWLVPHILWCIHGTMVTFRDLLRAASRPFLSAVGAATIAIAAQFFYGGSLSPIPRLILGVGFLFSSYLWMLLYVMGQKAFYFDLLQGMRGRSAPLAEESVGF